MRPSLSFPVKRTLLPGLLALMLLLAGRPALRAQAPSHQAAVVVVLEDGRVIARLVSFEEETISGQDLLERSGLDVALVGGLGPGGVAVCAIEGVGCPPTPQECFCRCRGGGECRYWSYFSLEEGAWVYSPIGAAARRLGDGDVDGWVWGDGSDPPPALTWAEIVALAGVAAPTATPVPTPPPTSLPPSPTPPPGEGSRRPCM